MVMPAGAETRLQVNLLAGRSESVAGLSNTSKASSSVLNSELCSRRTGALFTSLTMRVKLLVSLKAGTPLSVTCTVIRLVLGPCASLGVQLNTPEWESRVIPSGADSRLKANVLAGMSASAAVLVTTKGLNSLIVWLGGTRSTGALFCSLTSTVKLPVSLKGGEPLSVTRTVIRLMLARCASVGVQLSTPLLGSRLIPSGAESRLKRSVSAGTSGSVAELVTTSVASPWITLYGGTVSTGALFSSLTATVKLLLSLNGGEPLSVTRTVIRLVLGS